MTLSDSQRKMLVDALGRYAATEDENGRYARDVPRNGNGPRFYAISRGARELAALIEGAESVTVWNGRAETLVKLRELANDTDAEESHSEADGLILRYIADEEIGEAWAAVPKWYS